MIDMVDKFRFLILLLIARSIKVWNWRKRTIYLLSKKRVKFSFCFSEMKKTKKEKRNPHMKRNLVIPSF